MPIHQLVYTSYATVPFDGDELQRILEHARAANYTQGLTGVLLFSAGQFLQVLEGEPQTVRAVYGRIGRDVRHNDLQLLADGAVATRTFPDWTMGFVPLDGIDFSRVAGYIDPSRADFLLPRAHNADPELLGLIRDFIAGQRVEY